MGKLALALTASLGLGCVANADATQQASNATSSTVQSYKITLRTGPAVDSDCYVAHVKLLTKTNREFNLWFDDCNGGHQYLGNDEYQIPATQLDRWSSLLREFPQVSWDPGNYEFTLDEGYNNPN